MPSPPTPLLRSWLAASSARLGPLRPCARVPSRRAMSSSAAAAEAGEDHPRLYVSSSQDPWFNLAFEDWLYKNTPAALPMLFLYRNKECVVLGRNQNPWKEINIPLLEQRGIPFVRRRSGGGTVYHDLGNTNYSIMVPKDIFDRRPNAELVTRALQALGVPAEVNHRSDITLDGAKMRFLYISGSAYRLNNRRAYHHGTMLIDARLDQLGAALRSGRTFSESKGTDSVSSPVRNIASLHPDVSHGRFVDAVLAEFEQTYAAGAGQGVVDVNPASVGAAGGQRAVEVLQEADDLKAWAWQYGQTPEFTVELESPTLSSGVELRASITSKHGLITRATLVPSTPADPLTTAGFACLASELVGRRFGQRALGQAAEAYVVAGDGQGAVERETREWLARAM